MTFVSPIGKYQKIYIDRKKYALDETQGETREMNTRDKTELLKRYTLFIISLFFAALGVAFTKRGALGVSPISSVANVMSYKFTTISIVLSLLFFDFKIVGTREGTILSAFCTGIFVKLFTKKLKKPVEKIIGA